MLQILTLIINILITIQANPSKGFINTNNWPLEMPIQQITPISKEKIIVKRMRSMFLTSIENPIVPIRNITNGNV